MALDSALKRASAINIGNPWRGILPFPDNVVDVEDRLVVSLLYSGIAAGEFIPPEPEEILQVPLRKIKMNAVSTATFTRPTDTTQYAANDLVANDVDAADVVPMLFTVSKLGRGRGIVRRAVLFKDTETVTAAIFALHLFSREPDVNNGDNGAFQPTTSQFYLGSIPIDMSTGAVASGTDVSKAGVPTADINFDLTVFGQSERRLWGLLSTGASGTYTPGNGERFTVNLEVATFD